MPPRYSFNTDLTSSVNAPLVVEFNLGNVNLNLKTAILFLDEIFVCSPVAASTNVCQIIN